MPDDVSLTLLAIAAKETATGKPAQVTVFPAREATDGDAIAVNGAFLLADADVLSQLVTDGPQLFKVTNEGTTATSARILAAFEV